MSQSTFSATKRLSGDQSIHSAAKRVSMDDIKQFTSNRAMSLDETFDDVQFNPQFSYFRVAEKKTTSLEWKDLKFKVKEKEILRGITGRVEGSNVCALMGPSGAGKSSLMNVLAGRVLPTGTKVIEGEILVNGVPAQPIKYRRSVAYVMQDDMLFPTNTVRETIEFSARLRLPTSITQDPDQLQGIVDDLVESLGLSHVQDTIVGSSTLRGVSGGERKRVAIGVEVVTNPSMLFLDEPTSGLDSFNAWKVIKILQNLGAATGACILCTIHQPSSEVFNEFENVVILSKGSVMYNGLVSDMPEIFHKLGKPVPHLTNPADYVMLVAQTVTDDKLVRFNIHTGYSKPEIDYSGFRTMGQGRGENGGFLENAEADFDSKEPVAGFVEEMKYLTQREYRTLWRDPNLLWTSLITQLVMNLLIGCIYWKAADRDDSDFEVGNAMSALLFGYIGIFMSTLSPQLINFPLDKGIMLREYQTATYGSLSYLLSKVTLEVPRLLLDSSATWVVLYFLYAMQGNFGFAVLLGALVGMCSGSLGQVIGAVAKDARSAQTYSPVLLVTQMMFSGLFIAINKIPLALRWLQWTSILKFAAAVGILVEFKECRDDSRFNDLQQETANCSIADAECLDRADYFEFLVECRNQFDRQNIDEDNLALFICLMGALVLAFKVLTLGILVIRSTYFAE